MASSPRVAIVGAGPGGLLLARMLHGKGVDCTVFEREGAFSARDQGGTLDLHRKTGQKSLKAAGLLDAFLAAARYEGQETRLYDTHGALVAQKPANAGEDRPEIDRHDLRRILLVACPAEIIRWNHGLDDIRPSDDGGYRLRFGQSAPERFDVVVGADGAWSKVRPLLSDARPRYTGSTLYEMTIVDVDARHPEIAGFVGQGTALIEGEGKAVIVQRNTNGDVRVYAGLHQASAASAPDRGAVASQFVGWGPIVADLFAATTGRIRPWPIFTLPEVIAGRRVRA